MLLRLAGRVERGLVNGQPLNPHSRDPSTFEGNYRALIANLVVDVGGELRSEPDLIVCAIDGTYGAPEEQLIRSAVSSSAASCESVLFVDRAEASIVANEIPNERLILLHAGRIAFCASLCLDQTRRGLTRRGGYGPFSIDDGGGYTMGRWLLLRLLEDLDEGRDSLLGKRVRELVGWFDRHDPLRWIRNAGDGFSLLRDVSELGRLVVELSGAGISDAEDLVSNSAKLLAANAIRLLTSSGFDPADVTFGFTGSIALGASTYRDKVVTALEERIGGAVSHRILEYGVLDGCLSIGLRSMGMTLDEWRYLSGGLSLRPVSTER